MSAIRSAVAELMAWGAPEPGPWPAAANGLIEIVSQGLADLGLPPPPLSGPPDGPWVEAFFVEAAALARLPEPVGAAARTRNMLRYGHEHAAYHTAAIGRLGHLDRLREAWDGPHQAAIRVSLAELVSHLAIAFAEYGRVPHCGPAGRSLLPGAVTHDGPERFLPTRPAYRFAGDDAAEVQLNFGLPIFVDIGDDSVCPDIIRTGWWEPWTHGIVKKCVGRGDVVVNVGANVGYYTLLMASLAQDQGRVFAFEPNPRLFSLLQRSVLWGGLMATTTIFPFAASDSRGSAKFIASRKHMGGGGLARRELGRTGDSEVELRLRRLRARYPRFQDEDLIALQRLTTPLSKTFDVHTSLLDETVGTLTDEIHFMLIDAEGAEPKVLDGARDLIRRSRDLTMVVEWSSGLTYTYTEAQRKQAAATIRWLAEDGFRFWRILGDVRDVYACPAILEPMTPDEVINMEGYGDLYLCRQPA